MWLFKGAESIVLYTIQMAKNKKLDRSVLDNLEIIDITIKSSKKPWSILAPTWSMVMDYKQGSYSKEDYVRDYNNLIDKRLANENNNILKALVDMALRNNVALACYCKPGDFCHRLLLAERLKRLGVYYGGELVG